MCSLIASGLNIERRLTKRFTWLVTGPWNPTSNALIDGHSSDFGAGKSFFVFFCFFLIFVKEPDSTRRSAVGQRTSRLQVLIIDIVDSIRKTKLNSDPSEENERKKRGK